MPFKSIKFYLANDEKLAIKIKADGLYVSSFNKKENYNKEIK